MGRRSDDRIHGHGYDLDMTNDLSTGGEHGVPAIVHVPVLVPIEPVDIPSVPLLRIDETGAIGV